MKEIVCEMDDDVTSGSLVTWNGRETRCVPLRVPGPGRRPYTEAIEDLKSYADAYHKARRDLESAERRLDTLSVSVPILVAALLVIAVVVTGWLYS